jgi:trimeric autotransporter adhesin
MSYVPAYPTPAKHFPSHHLGKWACMMSRAAPSAIALILSTAVASACNSGNVASPDLLTSANCQGTAVGGIAVAVGSNARANGLHSVAIGTGAAAEAEKVTVLGWSAGATGSATTGPGATMIGSLAGRGDAGEWSIALGGGDVIDNAPHALGGGSIAIGAGHTTFPGAVASGAAGIAIGNRSVAGGEGFGTALGYNAKANVGLGPTALGVDSSARGSNAAAFGRFSSATDENSTSLGSLAHAQKRGSVAIGFGSIANVANTVSVGSSDRRRRIVNVGPAVLNSDAATLGQVKNIAAAAAQAAAEGMATTKSNEVERELNELRSAVLTLQKKVAELESRSAFADAR